MAENRERPSQPQRNEFEVDAEAAERVHGGVALLLPAVQAAREAARPRTNESAAISSLRALVTTQ